MDEGQMKTCYGTLFRSDCVFRIISSLRFKSTNKGVPMVPPLEHSAVNLQVASSDLAHSIVCGVCFPMMSPLVHMSQLLTVPKLNSSTHIYKQISALSVTKSINAIWDDQFSKDFPVKSFMSETCEGG